MSKLGILLIATAALAFEGCKTRETEAAPAASVAKSVDKPAVPASTPSAPQVLTAKQVLDRARALAGKTVVVRSIMQAAATNEACCCDAAIFLGDGGPKAASQAYAGFDCDHAAKLDLKRLGTLEARCTVGGASDGVVQLDNCEVLSQIPGSAPSPAKVKVDPAADQNLVRTAPTDRTSIFFTSPTGEKVTVKTVVRIDGDYVVDLVVAGKVVETIPTPTGGEDPAGPPHFEAKASVSAIPEGILAVTDTAKVTGKVGNDYDARVLIWNAATKRLEVARKITFSDQYDPSMDR